MNVKIDTDELYPYYHISDTCGKEVIVHANKLKKWDKIDTEFWKMQQEMDKLIGEED